MSSPDYLSKLRDMVEHLVQGDWSVSEFEASFYGYFIDEVPEDALGDRDFDFFCRLQENLDWTAAKPDAESRRSGWGNHADYLAWAQRAWEAYEADRELPPRWS